MAIKKFILGLCLSGIFGGAQAQQVFTINGVAPKGITTVYITPIDGRKPIDSVAVKKGKFVLNHKTSGDRFFVVYGKEDIGEGAEILLNCNVTVDLATGNVKGSELNEKLSAVLTKLRPWEQKGFEAMKSFSKLRSGVKLSDEEHSRMEEDMASSQRMAAEITQDFIAANADNVLPADMILRNGAYHNYSREALVQLCKSGRPYLQCPQMARIVNLAKRYENSIKGSTVTDFTMTDTAGVSHKLTEYVGQGNYVLVDFWASWCGPCRMEMPNVRASYEKYHAKGFEIVGVSLDKDAAAWRGAMKQMKMTWPQLSDLKGWQSEAAGIYGINSIPFTVLFGPDGKVVSNNLRGQDLDNFLAKIYDNK